MTGTLQYVRRRRAVALVMGVPTLVISLCLSAVEVSRVRQPDAPLFITPAAASLADAIASGNALGAYELIRGGQDPRQPIAVRHTVLTGGRSMRVSPLVWAVATERNQIVALLWSVGARVDAATGQRAICLAERLGNDEVARLLRAYGEFGPPGPCPPREAGEPVVPWLTDAE